MGVYTALLKTVTGRRLAEFRRACATPEVSQLAVLKRIVARAAGTEWGRRYGYADIRDYDQFRRRVPISQYEEMAPLWLKACEGARDVTWPGHVDYFALSSGTTAGNKLLPVTAEAIRSNIHSGAVLLATMATRGGFKGLVSGGMLYLGGCTTLRQRGQCLYGDASGIVARHIPFYGRRRTWPAPDIAALTDWEEKIRRVVERYLTADVCSVSACPSWAAMVFKEMREEALRRGMGERTIGELWPGLTHIVSYGMAFEPYRTAFDAYIGRPVRYVNTYSSSETGMTAIQEEAGGPLTMIVGNGVFYEFIPADKADQPDPPRLHIGQVQTGRDYALLVSTNGGIWAYALGDVVRFESLCPPRITFAGRTQIMLSAFGEHVDMGMMEKAVAAACAKTSAIVADYTVAPRFPSPAQPRPAHRWIVEFDRPPADASVFMAAIDASIRAECEDYDTHRANDYGLEPPILIQVAPRTFYEWMKRKGKLGGQNKVPRVVRSPEMADELLSISEGLAQSQ
ncbi:MAG: GH3 auxin-responsive promoter family protein [Phycisphaerae bacterium]